MPDVIMEMERGQMKVEGEAVAPTPKIRKFPDVPPTLLAQARELELEKQELAKLRAAAGTDYDPVVLALTQKICAELNALWIIIRETQKRTVVARHARERLKQTEAAEKAARRLGNAD